MRPVVIAVGAMALVLLAGCGAPAPPGPSAPGAPSTMAPTAASPPAVPSPTPAVSMPLQSTAMAFSATISPVTAADLVASWHEGCPVGPDQLRALDVTHWGYDGAVHTGRLIVAEEVSADIAGVMGDLFELRFPIERITPVDVFGGDDDASMAANNTSAFNCRAVTGGTGWSEHAFGEAIDLNPVANPYVLGDMVLPPSGVGYLDRSVDLPGMIRADDGVVRAFAARGWTWGGDWTSPADYQHFSRSGG